MGRLEVDWKDVFGVTSSPSRERDLCFGDPLSAAKWARASGPGRAASRASSSDEQQSPGTHRLPQKLDRRRVHQLRRSRAQVVGDGARRSATPAAAKADEAAAWGTDAPPAADEDARSSSDEDEGREHASPSAALGGEKNYGQLHMHTSERRRQGGQTDPIAVDKMYSSQPCCAALSGNRCKVHGHAIDAEESDHEKSQKSESPTFSCCAKRCILCKSLVGAAPPEEIFETLRAVPSLARTDLLRPFSMLINDDRRFRSLMALPKGMRKDWLLMDLDRSQ